MRSRIKKPTQMQVVALGYLCVMIVGTLLLALPCSSREGTWTGFTDAFMTSTSAACVTGLIPVGTYDHWSGFGQAVLLVLMQVGGLGIMTLMASFTRLLGRNMTLGERKLFMLSSGNDSVGGVSKLIRSVLLYTFSFEAVGAVILAIRFIPDHGIYGLWEAVFHSVSAFCNAGFDLMGKYGQASLTGYAGDVTVNLVIMFLILCGGVGFIVWQDIFSCRFDPKKFSLHTKVVLVMTGILLFSGAALFLVFEAGKTMPLGERILTAFFNSVTARTAGFNTVSFADMSPASVALMIILMIIGGAPGSTAGGIKVTTFVTLLAGTLASARQVAATNIFKRRIDGDLIRQASAIATIYFTVVSAGITAVAAIERIDLSWVTFEVVSALSNVGVTMGITGSLTVASKLILCLLMYFGRVGMISLVIALAAKRENVPISRPVENLLL